MNVILYGVIFISKVVENALATLRLIVVANGKKWLGAILQFMIALVWVLVTGAVVVDIKKDPLKVVFFAFGSFVGSYIGCFIEEKIALGNNVFMIVTTKEYAGTMASLLRRKHYGVTILDGSDLHSDKKILMVVLPRKKGPEIIELLKRIDKDLMIISEKVHSVGGNSTEKSSA